MAKKKSEGINFFQKYLTIWVFICMVVGVIIGKLLPAIPNALGSLEISGISIPIAILIWIMIYPMMITIDISADIYVSVGSYSEKSYTHNTDCNTFDNSDIFDLWNRIRSVLSVKTATQYCSTCRNDRSI